MLNWYIFHHYILVLRWPFRKIKFNFITFIITILAPFTIFGRTYFLVSISWPKPPRFIIFIIVTPSISRSFVHILLCSFGILICIMIFWLTMITLSPLNCSWSCYHFCWCSGHSLQKISICHHFCNVTWSTSIFRKLLIRQKLMKFSYHNGKFRIQIYIFLN